MIISLIAAIAMNRVIGINNTIPWHLSSDLAWFRRHTINKPIIMGSRTFQSIGKPLPKRHNIVLSRYGGNEKNVTWVSTPAQALAVVAQEKEVMLIGGGKTYETFLPQATRLYLTHINKVITGDTWFPQYNHHEWKSVFTEFHDVDQSNIYSYFFEVLERRKFMSSLSTFTVWSDS